MSASLQWSATLGGTLGLAEDFFGIAVTADGRAIATGNFFQSKLGADFWVTQLEADGSPGWELLLDGTGTGNDGGRAVALVDDTIYVAGKLSTTMGGEDWMIGELQLDGTLGWTTLSGGLTLGDDVARGIASGADGALYTTGRQFSTETDADVLIRQYLDGGIEGWSTLYDGSAHGYDSARAIAAIPSGELAVAGIEAVENHGHDGWIAKYGPDGGLLWSDSQQGPAGLDDIASGVAVDSEGSVYAVGFTTVAEGRSAGWVRKWTPDGNPVWTYSWGGDASTTASFLAVAVDHDDNIIAVGSDSTDIERGIIHKLDPQGSLLWSERFGAPIEGNKRFRAVAIGPSDHIWAAGYIDLGPRADGVDGWVVRVAP